MIWRYKMPSWSIWYKYLWHRLCFIVISFKNIRKFSDIPQLNGFFSHTQCLVYSFPSFRARNHQPAKHITTTGYLSVPRLYINHEYKVSFGQTYARMHRATLKPTLPRVSLPLKQLNRHRASIYYFSFILKQMAA